MRHNVNWNLGIILSRTFGRDTNPRKWAAPINLNGCKKNHETNMGKPVGKASACLREAASAKAGANL